MVLRDPRAIVVHPPEVVLRVGVPLVSGEAVPPGCLGVVLRDPRAIVVHPPEVPLRNWRVSARRSRDLKQEPFEGVLGRDA